MRRSKSQHRARGQSKTLNKRNCQLTQFPTTKLHILQHIEVLDISHNSIYNFASLALHNRTSQHALQHLVDLNIGYNQINCTSSLVPLASTAHQLERINVEGNPLCQTLNFLFEIMAMFTDIKWILHGETTEVNYMVRQKSIYFHLNGGKMMAELINAVSNPHKFLQKTKKQPLIAKIQEIIETLQAGDRSTLTKNESIIQSIKSLLILSKKSTGQNSFSLIQNSNKNECVEIEALNTYEIQPADNNNGVCISPARKDSKDWNPIVFYLQQMLFSPLIEKKLLQQLQVDQQTNRRYQQGKCDNFDISELLLEMNTKWIQQSNMVSHPNTASTSYSPFKSVFTNDATERQGSVNRFEEQRVSQCYFGFDGEWAEESFSFVKHRLMSLLRVLISCQQRVEEVSELGYSNSWTLTLGCPKPMNHPINYQDEQLLQQELTMNNDDSLSSYYNSAPVHVKYRTALITGTHILQTTIKRIIFRHLSHARIIKQPYIAYFQHTLQKIIARQQQLAMRNIFQEALLHFCIESKLNKLKLRRIFQGWKQIRKRKLKLISTLLKKKTRREKAFKAVTMTQWRITARNMSTMSLMRHKMQQLTAECALADTSAIVINNKKQGMRRSSTCQRLGFQITKRGNLGSRR